MVAFRDSTVDNCLLRPNLSMMYDRLTYRIKAGNITNLKISKEEIAPPDEEEVLIEVQSIGLNFADVFAILGLYSATPKGSFIPGLEFSGLVLEVGSGVSAFKAGDRVMGVTRFGAYSNMICVDYRYVIPLTADWSFEEGASYLVQMLTAYYGLKHLGDIQDGKTVLIHSAAGGVGIWANRIAKAYQCFTVGSVGSASKKEITTREGYDAAIVRRNDTFKSDIIDALQGRPLDLIMECIGGSIMRQGFDLLAPMGRLIVYGSAHYGGTGNRPFWPKLIWKYLNRPKIDPQNMIRQNKSVMAFNLIYLFDHIHLMHAVLEEIRSLHLGRPIIGETYSFDQLPTAIKHFQSGQTVGKVVVNI